jgi:hypothetical protein
VFALIAAFNIFNVLRFSPPYLMHIPPLVVVCRGLQASAFFWTSLVESPDSEIENEVDPLSWMIIIRRSPVTLPEQLF